MAEKTVTGAIAVEKRMIAAGPPKVFSWFVTVTPRAGEGAVTVFEGSGLEDWLDILASAGGKRGRFVYEEGPPVVIKSVTVF